MSAKVGTASGSSSGGSQRVSKFAVKSGYVIPKNKLSGSLVPIFRGDKNVGASDHGGSRENKKQAQRKTKWGADLTQDASVRKLRALAYQTRVDQITQQLKSGISDVGNNENMPSTHQKPDHISSRHQVDKEAAEQLELEKREIISEILKLNPSYKAPSDYKPLLKEATVPIPANEYPRYNFVALIYGPGGDNQKQLEKETGAKIQVYGTKTETGEKIEIKEYAGSDIQGEYEKLYVHVSADTYEKVDAAVAVIELLVTSLSGNLAVVTSQGQDTSTSDMAPTTMVDQGLVHATKGPTQTPANGQFQYPDPFFSSGQSGSLMNTPGFTPRNYSRPVLDNPAHLSTSSFNSTNQPSLFRPPPPLFSPRQQHLSPPVLQHTYMPQTSPGSLGPPRNLSMMTPQPPSAQIISSAPVIFFGNCPPPTGQTSITDPFAPSFPQPMSNPNHLNASPTFTSVPQPNPYMNPMSGSTPVPSQPRIHSSVSGSAPNFNPIKPPMVTPPSPGDFTFQPHRPQNQAFQTVPQQSNQFSGHSAHPAGQMGRPQPPPSFQMALQNMAQPSNQMSAYSAYMSAVQFGRNSTAISVPPRLPTFLDTNPVAPRAPLLPMRPGNYNPAHQMHNLPGPLPPRPGNHIQIQHGYPAHMGSNQQFINNQYASGKPASNPGGHLLYDPFSPTSDPTGRR